MKWIEKNWVVVLIVVVAYLWFNGSLGNLLGSSSGSASSLPSGPVTLGG